MLTENAVSSSILHFIRADSFLWCQSLLFNCIHLKYLKLAFYINQGWKLTRAIQRVQNCLSGEATNCYVGPGMCLLPPIHPTKQYTYPVSSHHCINPQPVYPHLYKHTTTTTQKKKKKRGGKKILMCAIWLLFISRSTLTQQTEHNLVFTCSDYFLHGIIVTNINLAILLTNHDSSTDQGEPEEAILPWKAQGRKRKMIKSCIIWKQRCRRLTLMSDLIWISTLCLLQVYLGLWLCTLC